MWFQGIEFQPVNRTTEFLPRALDFGCGNGDISLLLLDLGFDVIGCDIDASCGTRIADRLPGDCVNRFDFIELAAGVDVTTSLRGSKFDLIVCREVLEHVPDPSLVLDAFRSLLVKDGQLVVSCPAAFSESVFCRLDNRWLEKCEHLSVFSRKALVQKLETAGLNVYRVEGQGFHWSVMWALLAPFKTDHRMGNPKSLSRLVRFAMAAAKCVEQAGPLESLGNRFFPKSHVYYARRKPIVVSVVYDYDRWILGRWAKNIERLYSHEYDIRPISMFDLESRDKTRRQEAEAIIKQSCLIHLLLPHCFNAVSAISEGVPIITTIHHWIEWSFVKGAAERSDQIVTGAQVWKDRLCDNGIAAERITVVYSGIEADIFCDIGANFRKWEGKITLGFFAKKDSNEFDRKGVRHFVALINEMIETDTISEFRFVVSGPGWADLVGELRRKSVDILYKEQTEYEEMPNLYRSVDVYLMLSDVEGGPATVVEAMACGCLVFATRVGVVADFIRDGVNGIIVESSDSRGILNRITYFRDHNDEAASIVEEAYRFAFENMTYDRTMAPLGPLYERCIAFKYSGM